MPAPTDAQCGTLQIGIFADNLKLPLRDGLRTAVELGVPSFQMYTSTNEMAGGEFTPEQMTAADRAAFRRYYEGLGLQLSATCGDFGHGFVDPVVNESLIPKTFAQIDLAVDLGASIITTHIGVVPAERNAEWQTLRGALNRIGAYAEQKGVVLATETGPESGPVLRALLDALDTSAIRVNFDPANLTMAGFDLDEALEALLPFIVHTHAKDGVRDPEAWSRGRWQEVPLGEGDVPWERYITRLREAGYTGAFTIEREVGADPVADMQKAIDFLRTL
jgi:sugar phosphate isomerase/epimerase